MSQFKQLDVLKIIAENTTDIILFVDNDGKIIYGTPSIKNTMGYEKEDLIGQDAFTTLHPDDRERVKQLHEEVVQKRQSMICDYRVFGGDGTLLYFESNVKPVLDEYGQTMLSVVVIRDISDRKKAEIALRESAERYQILQKSIIQLSNNEHSKTDETPIWVLRLLFNLFEKERLVISDDLHDSVLQNLINSYRKVENIHSSAVLDKEWKDELSEIEEGLLDIIYEIRNIVTELRPPFLKELGVVQILQNLIDYTTQFNSNTNVILHSNQTNYTLTEEQTLGVYRISRELLNNALKHANANTVEFTLSQANNEFIVQYNDDGVGFDVTQLEQSFTHTGISGIRKRVQSMLGTSTFHSSSNKGLQVEIKIPFKNERTGGGKDDESVVGR